jgi:2-polyprenyl-6-methoxyphenol hydroxylase-like FAD-dependent oxidoreductase
MNILIAGAGPAGLYLAYLLKRQHPGQRIRIVEQNPPDATFGFGVVFSDRALDFLRDDDAETHALIVPAMHRWTDLTLVHRGQRIVIDGVGFAAIGRLALLQRLQQRLATVGIVPEYRTVLDDARVLDGWDLVVAADGANSFVRRAHGAAFGTQVEALNNRFVWYGTPQPFDTLTQTFIDTRWGGMNAHHYPYAPGMSTFIVECAPDTWQRAGFEHRSEDETRVLLQDVFADTLGGRPLVANKSLWRQFPKLRNTRWSVGNTVLVGDALRTAHFSIGSGTRLAFEDVIALAKALREHGDDVQSALQAYEAARRPVVDKLVAAANQSAEWYEHFTEHMRLAPWDLAFSYIQRSGRVDIDKLRTVSPGFVAGYQAWRAAAAA